MSGASQPGFRFALPAVVARMFRFLGLAAMGMSAALALDPTRAISQYRRTVWNNANGLPQNSALAIAQAKDGTVWVGTDEGVALFDGVRFSVLNLGNTPQLGTQIVRLLAAGRDGSMWGATSATIFRYESGAVRVYGSKATA